MHGDGHGADEEVEIGGAGHRRRRGAGRVTTAGHDAQRRIRARRVLEVVEPRLERRLLSVGAGETCPPPPKQIKIKLNLSTYLLQFTYS